MVFKTKRKAKTRAMEVLSMLKGSGWKIRVWENLGWYYGIYRHNLRVYENFDKTFHCLLSAGGHAGGLIVWADKNYSYTNPNKAVRKQFKQARKYVQHLQKVIYKNEIKE